MCTFIHSPICLYQRVIVFVDWVIVFVDWNYIFFILEDIMFCLVLIAMLIVLHGACDFNQKFKLWYYFIGPFVYICCLCVTNVLLYVSGYRSYMSAAIEVLLSISLHCISIYDIHVVIKPMIALMKPLL